MYGSETSELLLLSLLNRSSGQESEPFSVYAVLFEPLHPKFIIIIWIDSRCCKRSIDENIQTVDTYSSLMEGEGVSDFQSFVNCNRGDMGVRRILNTLY